MLLDRGAGDQLLRVGDAEAAGERAEHGRGIDVQTVLPDAVEHRTHMGRGGAGAGEQAQRMQGVERVRRRQPERDAILLRDPDAGAVGVTALFGNFGRALGAVGLEQAGKQHRHELNGGHYAAGPGDAIELPEMQVGVGRDDIEIPGCLHSRFLPYKPIVVALTEGVDCSQIALKRFSHSRVSTGSCKVTTPRVRSKCGLRM